MRELEDARDVAHETRAMEQEEHDEAVTALLGEKRDALGQRMGEDQEQTDASNAATYDIADESVNAQQAVQARRARETLQQIERQVQEYKAQLDRLKVEAGAQLDAEQRQPQLQQTRQNGQHAGGVQSTTTTVPTQNSTDELPEAVSHLMREEARMQSIDLDPSELPENLTPADSALPLHELSSCEPR